MPHECTACGHTFPDGSKEMLSGCPECGGNKFQFMPAGSVEDDPDSENELEGTAADPASGETSSRGTPISGGGADPVETSRDRGTDGSFDFGEDAAVTGPDSTDDSPAESDSVEGAGSTDTALGTEDHAQASARSTVVSEDELPPSDEPIPVGNDTPTREETIDEEEGDEHPDLSELREELNDQFESIKILQPGEYELNLMELYDREERIVALEEDGRYVIDVPSSWREEDE